jgi:hypothetical protein
MDAGANSGKLGADVNQFLPNGANGFAVTLDIGRALTQILVRLT